MRAFQTAASRPFLNAAMAPVRSSRWMAPAAMPQRVMARYMSDDILPPRWFVLNISGPNKPSIVHKLAEKISGNIEESRMLCLGKDFGCVMLITTEGGSASEVRSQLEVNFPAEKYSVSVRETAPALMGFTRPTRVMQFAMQGPDQPGVVRAITKLFAMHSVQVRDAATDLTSAPFSGFRMFVMRSVIAIPNTVDLEKLSADLRLFEEESGFQIQFGEGEGEEEEGGPPGPGQGQGPPMPGQH